MLRVYLFVSYFPSFIPFHVITISHHLYALLIVIICLLVSYWLLPRSLYAIGRYSF